MRGNVRIIAASDAGVRVCAAAARISTTDGSAAEIFAARQGGERDVKLVKKVLSSGHKSLIEHHVFTIAFSGVSVLVEQFVIEHRLASYTVKSRRYVDFSAAGFYVPDDLPDGLRAPYEAHMRALFADYGALLELGVPKEDARFVLPYCFLSHFYMTVNARELILMVRAMLYGRGRDMAELREIGASLKEQLEAIYPGVVGDAERAPLSDVPLAIGAPTPVFARAELLDAPRDARALLNAALRFTGRLPADDFAALVRDERPRELECLNYTFLLGDVSLSCLTHIARHRVQSPLFPDIAEALRGHYVLPASVAENAPAQALYERAFSRNRAALEDMLAAGMPAFQARYFALSGYTVDMMTTMNARELLHFLRLRTCNRAQWEIRGAAQQMLTLLKRDAEPLFRDYGPSCVVLGYCPEGRLSCGRMGGKP